MLHRSPLLPLAVLILLPATSRAADAGAPVAYDLQFGGFIIDGCLECDRIPIQKPLVEGTFTVTARPSLPGAQVHDLTDIDITSEADAYRVKGSGTYTEMVTHPPSWRLELKVTINDGEEISLEGKAESGAPWPLIDLLVEETAPTADRDFSIRLIAAPIVDQVPYTLEKDASFYLDCPPCGRPIRPIAAVGEFLAGKVEENSLFSIWRIDGFTMHDAGGEGLLVVMGSGWYRQGGEVALVQEMGLRVRVLQPDDYPEWADLHGEGGVDAALPAVQVGVADRSPPAITQVLTLTISAKPAAPTIFLRGDANADLRIDLSDGVYLLWWLFLGGARPSCAEAADANDDAKFDLSDALAIFSYLYQGGKAPPDPGPFFCGLDPTKDPSTCLDYPPCPPAGTR